MPHLSRTGRLQENVLHLDFLHWQDREGKDVISEVGMVMMMMMMMIMMIIMMMMMMMTVRCGSSSHQCEACLSVHVI
jgi:heme/copper-type cytochrome/quinol oxidase subunit 2